MTDTTFIPKTPLQERAFALLRSVKEFDRSRPELIELNSDNWTDTRSAILFLRGNNLIHITGYSLYTLDPIYRAGPGRDAPRPKSRKKNLEQMPAARPFTIPAPDPLLAALFARPIPGLG